jgi:hypothetical protein
MTTHVRIGADSTDAGTMFGGEGGIDAHLARMRGAMRKTPIKAVPAPTTPTETKDIEGPSEEEMEAWKSIAGKTLTTADKIEVPIDPADAKRIAVLEAELAETRKIAEAKRKEKERVIVEEIKLKVAAMESKMESKIMRVPEPTITLIGELKPCTEEHVADRDSIIVNVRVEIPGIRVADGAVAAVISGMIHKGVKVEIKPHELAPPLTLGGDSFESDEVDAEVDHEMSKRPHERAPRSEPAEPGPKLSDRPLAAPTDGW